MSEEPIEHGKELGPPKNLATGVIKAIRPRQWVKRPGPGGAAGRGPIDVRDRHRRAGRERYQPGAGLGERRIGVRRLCLAASAIYLINDALDVEADRNHPTKRFRPIAAGVVPVNLAYVLFVIFAAGSIAVALLANWQTAVAIGIYLAIQIGYLLRPQNTRPSSISASCPRGSCAGDRRWCGHRDRLVEVVPAGDGLGRCSWRPVSLTPNCTWPSGTGAKRSAKSLRVLRPIYLRFMWTVAATSVVVFYGLLAGLRRGAHRFNGQPNDNIFFYALSMVPFTIAILRYAVDVDGVRPVSRRRSPWATECYRSSPWPG